MKNYKEKVQQLKTACDEFLSQVNSMGNENAWTDRKLEQIIDIATNIIIEYRNDGDKDSVRVECYGEVKTYSSRSQAIEIFTEAAKNSYGCERERYQNILLDLYDGLSYCSDQI